MQPKPAVAAWTDVRATTKLRRGRRAMFRAEVLLVSYAGDSLCRLFPGEKKPAEWGALNYSNCTSALALLFNPGLEVLARL
jgi:hypothetical protein